MDFVSVFLIAVGLAMDAFAVSLCKGFALRKVAVREMLIAGLWFGAVQAAMPIAGFCLGSSFYDLISAYDHWVAFLLLLLIGANMIREALSGGDEGKDPDMSPKAMLPLAVATSIDALAVGISLSMEEADVLVPAAVIGAVTLAISAAGVKLGSLFGDRYGSGAEAVGGAILILIGLRILLDGLGII